MTPVEYAKPPNIIKFNPGTGIDETKSSHFKIIIHPMIRYNATKNISYYPV